MTGPMPPYQNKYFKPSWITRGLTDVESIRPKLGEFTSGSGLANSAVLGALNCE
jgi:hypothetical protein